MLFRHPNHYDPDPAPPTGKELSRSTFTLDGIVYGCERHLTDASVRQFSSITPNSGNKKWVVKQGNKTELHNRQDECKYTKLVYPDALAEVIEINETSHRFINSFVEGDMFPAAALATPHRTGLLYLTYLAAIELQRIHVEKNVVHGDVKGNNLVIVEHADGSYGARWVDFEYASLIGELARAFTVNHASFSYLAPERCILDPKTQSVPVADVNQDVYSFGYLLAHPYSSIANGMYTLLEIPAIDIWYNASQSVDPTQRPTLASLIRILVAEMRLTPAIQPDTPSMRR